MFAESIGGFFLGLFTNAAYDGFKNLFQSPDSPRYKALVTAIDVASERFFEKYGEEYGKSSQCFIARQENLDIIWKSLFFSCDELTGASLNPEGFDGTKRAPSEVVKFFVTALLEEVRKDFELGKVLAVKGHHRTTDKVLENIESQQETLSRIEKLGEGQRQDYNAAQLRDAENFAILTAGNARIIQEIRQLTAGTLADKEAGAKIDRLLNDDIDQCREFIRNNKPQTALAILSRLKQNRWQDLNEGAKFRVLTNIAAAKLNLGQEQEAAEGFLQAEALSPDTVKALCNSALAYLVLGLSDKAMEKALRATAINPDDHAGYAMVVAVATKTPAIEDPFQFLPIREVNNHELAFHLAAFYRERKNLSEAKKWIEIAHQLEPGDPEILETYAVALLEEVFADPATTFGRQLQLAHVQTLEKIRSMLEPLWRNSDNSEIPKRLIPCAINLSNVERLLGNTPRATKIIKDALLRTPDNYELQRQEAFLAVEEGQHEHACSILADLPDEAFDGKLLIEAEALYKAKRHAEALTKINRFIRNVPNLPAKIAVTARTVRLHIIKETGGAGSALKEAEALASENPEEIEYIVAASQFSHDVGKHEEAVEWATRARGLIEANPDYFSRSIVADIYFQIGLYDEAAVQYKELVRSNQDTKDLRRLLICFAETDRRQEALEKISSLPTKVLTLPFYCHMAAIFYNRAGDLPSAIKYLNRYLEKTPADLRARLHWVDISRRLGQDAEVHEYLLNMPDFPDAAPEDTVYLIQLLALYGFESRANALGYEALRRHFTSQPCVHMCFMRLLLGTKPIPEVDRTSDLQKIEPGTAFTVALPSGERRTFIIEENGPIGVLEEEIDVSNPIAERALGLTCGESIVLLENLYRKEEGVIVEIKHKYLYLLHKSMAKYEYLFPTEQQFFSVPLKVEPEGEVDLQPILDMVSRRQDSILRIENIYQNNPIPIPIVAKALKLHPIDVWFGLQGRVKIAYCHGTPQERMSAYRLLENARDGLIFDPITLFSLFLLGVLEQIAAYSGKKVGITQSTLDLFSNLVASRRGMDDHLTLGKEGDTFVRTEYSKTDIEKSIEPFTNFLSWCRENCEIVPAVGKKVLSKDDEVNLDGLGEAFVDTLRAAESSGRLLISDDLNFRQYAKLVFDLNGVWSQPLLDMVHHCGHIDRTAYIEAILKISRMNYSFVSFTVADLRHALDVDITCGTSFFPEILSSMRRKEVDVFSVFSVASRFLVVLWKAHLSHSQKRKATFATLEAIVRHPAFAAEDMVLCTFACILRLTIVDKLLSNKLFQECRHAFTAWCEGHFMPVRTLWEGRGNNK